MCFRQALANHTAFCEDFACMHGHIGIVGAGVIGSALAFELSRRGVLDIHVFDADLEGGLSSTERNAGGVRRLWDQPINSALASHSLTFFETIRHEIGFKQNGYLWLFDKSSAPRGRKALERVQARGLPYSELSVAEIRNKYPFIDKTDGVSFGLLGPNDGIINSNALKQYLRRHAQEKGARFHDRSWVHCVTERGGEVVAKVCVLGPTQANVVLEKPGDAFRSETVEHSFNKWVICSGAWSERLLTTMGIEPLVQPVRRQIMLFSCEGLDLESYGMIVDTSRVYFHAEGGNVLAGLVLKNEPAGYRFHLDPDFFESRIWPALFERSSHFERLRFVTGWGGLYSYTPDTSGILGRVPGYRNVFESHSYTGRGVMQSIGAATAMAEFILFDRFETIDAASLSRARFLYSDGVHLDEELHI
jgi:glycine/D-amino acid oxidase-like deaminating enzyme